MKLAEVDQAEQMQSVETSHGEDVDQWDRFLRQCPWAHIEQSSGWASLKQIYGWNPTWLWIRKGREIRGGALILTRRIKRFASIAYIERGPLWHPGDDNAKAAVIDAVYRFASSRHIAYLAIALPYFGSEVIPTLEALQFRPKPNAFPPSNVGRATLLIDLTQSLDNLMAGMSVTKRQNIRRAVRKGVSVRLGDGDDAELMRDLMWSTCRRRGTEPAPPQRDYFHHLWRALGTAGRMNFFIAEVDGQPVAAATAFLSGDRMELWRVGWSGAHEDFNPNDLLHWEMMKWAKEHGCRFFDFLHIDPEHARAILRGERIKDSYSGVTDFKTAFGGQILLLPDLYYRSFSRVASSAFNLGAGRLVESVAFQQTLNRLSSGLMKWSAK
jgi:lipid II:glycine glycyltransferase (peptidoglycan interpeptide bridge formation enzyme)